MAAPSSISIRDQGALDLVRSLLRQGVSVRIKVSGGSMRPLLNGGEVVEISSVQSGNPRRGDILFFCEQRNTLLMHRLIRCRYADKTLYLQTKGDACAEFDRFVSADQILGRVQRIFLPADVAGRSNRIIDLNALTMRLQARLIVLRTLMRYYLYRTAVVAKRGLIIFGVFHLYLLFLYFSL
jgi:signal peptidase I